MILRRAIWEEIQIDSNTHFHSKTISYLAYAINIFKIIENKNAIVKAIDKKERYSIPIKRNKNRNPLMILMNLNILNVLLNSKSG